MNDKRYALIKENGEVAATVHPSSPHEYAHLVTIGEYLCVETPQSMYLENLYEGWYFKNVWRERASKPSDIHTWDIALESWLVDADTLRKDISNKVKAERDKRTQSGGYEVAGKWFHSDQASKTQQIALAMLGSNLPSDILWKTMDGTKIEMTPTLAAQIFSAAIANDAATFAAAETHLAAIAISEDPENYDYSTGWPPIFSEA